MDCADLTISDILLQTSVAGIFDLYCIHSEGIFPVIIDLPFSLFPLSVLSSKF